MHRKTPNTRIQIRKARSLLAVEIREGFVEGVLFDLRHTRKQMRI